MKYKTATTRRILVVTMFAMWLPAVASTGCGMDMYFSVIGKVLAGQLSQLTVDEVLWVNQTQGAIGGYAGMFGGEITELTRDQAQALVDFFQANNLDTFEDYTALLDSAGQGQQPAGFNELVAAFRGTASEISGPEELDELLRTTGIINMPSGGFL